MSLIFITKTIAQLFAHVQSVCIPHQSKLERGLIVINRKLGSAQLVCCWDGLLKLASLALCGSLLECHSRLEIWILGPPHEKETFEGDLDANCHYNPFGDEKHDSIALMQSFDDM